MNRCPRCQGPLSPDVVHNALSRLDNTTYICSPCGLDEALWDWSYPLTPMPPLDRMAR